MHLRNAISATRASELFVSGRVDVACLSSDAVGSAMAIRGEIVNGRWRVQTASPSDFERMPAMGILVEKTTPTVGVMQVLGSCDVFSELTPRQSYLVGENGTLLTEVPVVAPGEIFWAQHIGVSVADNILSLTGNTNMLGYQY